MVMITELRSIAPICCDIEELYADHILKRYTLSSEYLADYREDVLLILQQETVRAFQLPHEDFGARVDSLEPFSVRSASGERPVAIAPAPAGWSSARPGSQSRSQGPS